MKTDILIIGGGPAGIVAAINAKKFNPAKKITLIRKEEKGAIPCGIPYIFERLNAVKKNLMSDQSLLENKIKLVIEEVIKIEPTKKRVVLRNGSIFYYTKLILALGSDPQSIPIPGREKKGVWLIKKDLNYLKKLRRAVLKSKNIIIIGGGFIGVELAEELSRIKRLKVSLIEKLNHCLSANFDEEFVKIAEERLTKKGVKIFSGKAVKEICGEKTVKAIVLDNGKKLTADLIILAIGYKPNAELAREAGIKTEERKGISVNENSQTNLSDIFAIGDCAYNKDFITGEDISMMLASVATTEARIVTSNLYQKKVLEKDKGTVGAFLTYVGGLVLGAVGLIEKRAQERNIDYLIGEAEAFNHHPIGLAGTEKIKIKLIFSKSSRKLLLGGEIMGPESSSEMLNIISIAIQRKISLYDFNSLQIATHPLLTPSPTNYPLIAAAQNAILKIKE